MSNYLILRNTQAVELKCEGKKKQKQKTMWLVLTLAVMRPLLHCHE